MASWQSSLESYQGQVIPRENISEKADFIIIVIWIIIAKQASWQSTLESYQGRVVIIISSDIVMDTIKSSCITGCREHLICIVIIFTVIMWS